MSVTVTTPVYEGPFDLLLHEELISEKALKDLQESSADMRQTVQRLMSEYRINEGKLGNSLSIHYQVPFIPFDPDKFHLFQSESKLNSSYLKRNFVAVIADARDKPTVLMAEPNNASLLMEIESALGIDSYDIAVGLPNHILQYLGDSVGGGAPGEMSEILDEIGTSAEESDEHIDELSDDAPAVVRLVSRILHDAKRLNASDIHIDPEKNGPTRVRMRIDGVCRDINQVPASHHSAVIARIKIMSNLNIAEKRVPQDGRIALRIGGREVDVRVSTMPSSHGERVVMRLLDKQAGRLSLGQLGMSSRDLQTMRNIISKPHGIILVTGPTGSGKTTTLYGALSDLNDTSRNILTVEDPVEYSLPGIGQTQVNLKADMTFAKGLRAILRQDPDVVMIGEIRDLETVEIAIQASLTGHLVLSTLHTNTAVGAITRLQDMGVEPFLLSSSVIGVIAQRLVRVLCTDCKVPAKADSAECELLGISESEAPVIYHAKGCDKCNQLGYRGRQGIYEIIEVDEGMKTRIHDQVGEQELEAHARRLGPSIRQDGIRKVLGGHTTIEELLRVAKG